ncbi:MAG: uroporphyrinogen decarboxylase [Firmicutes bacterium]|nr:uroporphyrinogen decarboxylase [Bacillota bacterium]
MNSRERALAALNHREPDRVPIDFGGTKVTSITRPAYERLLEYLQVRGTDQGMSIDGGEAFVPSERIQRFLGADFRRTSLQAPDGYKRVIQADGTYVDEWGIRRKKVGFYWEICEFPLAKATVDDLERYPWPDPANPGRVRGLRDKVKALRENTDCAIIADGAASGVFLHACRMRGFEQFLRDLAADKRFANAFMDRLVEVYIGLYEAYMTAVGDYVDVVCFADDLGTQERTFVSPRMYREMIKPRQKQVFDAIKSRTRAKLFIHCDGAIAPIIRDFIEIGVDVLDPVQTSAAGMDPLYLKNEFGKDIVFWGGIDIQKVVSTGTAADVETEVRRIIEVLGPGGGYVLGATHNLQADTPPENILALYNSALKYGWYQA